MIGPKADKRGARACRADGTSSSPPHFPQILGASPRRDKKGGLRADLSVSGQDPFPHPVSSPGDRALWEGDEKQKRNFIRWSGEVISTSRVWAEKSCVGTVSESTTWVPQRGGALWGSCDHTQLGVETYLPRPSRAGQVDLKPDCFNSALCPTTSSAGVSNCLLKEQMSLTWVSSPAGWLSSCMALGKLRSSLELSLCYPSKENSETS